MPMLMGFSADALPDKRKTAILVHSLGTEGQCVLGALGSATTFEATVKLLTDHFSGKQRVLIRRYRLRKRHQRPGESIQTVVADLRELARACEYGALHDQMIRDQLIESKSCDKTRERLLMEPDDLTLTDAIKIALQVECALQCSTLLASPAHHTAVAQQLQRADTSQFSQTTAIIPDKYPLPTAEELTSLFHGSTVFSKLDLRQGYLQIPLHPASRDLTAFVTHAGVFRYTRMPFGLSSAPSCFQKVMSTVLAGVPGTAVYLDDIVVHGPGQATHDARLHRVFVALTKHHLTLNGEKCLFSVPTVDFIGFRLSADGIAPLSSNVDEIQRIPEPTSTTQVASFLGMTAYYLRFLPNYSQTTAPLRQLLKKEEPWAWSPQCLESFSMLKTQLTSPPVLAHFSLSSPTFITCDASTAAVGAVLSQLHDGREANRLRISGPDAH